MSTHLLNIVCWSVINLSDQQHSCRYEDIAHFSCAFIASHGSHILNCPSRTFLRPQSQSRSYGRFPRAVGRGATWDSPVT